MKVRTASSPARGTSPQPIIATRVYRRKKGRPVVLEVELPRQLGSLEWSCRIRVRGMRVGTRLSALGSDSLQALILALDHAARVLEQYRDELLGDAADYDSLGLPRMMPCYLAPSHYERLVRYVDLETLKIAQDLVPEFAGKPPHELPEEAKPRTPPGAESRSGKRSSPLRNSVRSARAGSGSKRKRR